MTKRLACAGAILAASLATAGCSSSRFAGFGGTSAPPVRVAPAPLPDDAVVSALPSGTVSSEPLAPLGSPVAPAPDLRSPSPPPQIANAAPSRSSAVGGWTAREATGSSCKVQLSSAPALDLYRASSSGCANRDLAKITAWDYREGDVYLYQPGGTVAARLRSGAGNMEGVLTKSGAPLTLVR